MTERNGEALVAEGLAKVYGQGATAVRAVDGVDLSVSRGELVLIKGPSGSGKTTLLSMLGGLLRPDRGTVRLHGQDLARLGPAALARARARHIGFVFQAYNLLGALDVRDNVLFPARLLGAPPADVRDGADALIKRLGLWDRRAAKPDRLSGGERQRVAIARALINDPVVILADEPTGNLDSQRGLEVAMLLRDIAREDRRAIVIVTHDPRIEDVADRVLWLEDGRLRDRKREPHDWVTDPVCGMRLDRWVARITLEHAGRSYTFCSEPCRERFRAEPESYGATGQPTRANSQPA